MMIFISVPLNRMHKIVARHLIFVNSFFPSFSREKKYNRYAFPSLKRCNSCLLGLFVDTRLCIFIYTPLWCFSSVYFRLNLCILHSRYLFFSRICVFFLAPNFSSIVFTMFKGVFFIWKPYSLHIIKCAHHHACMV